VNLDRTAVRACMAVAAAAPSADELKIPTEMIWVQCQVSCGSRSVEWNRENSKASGAVSNFEGAASACSGAAIVRPEPNEGAVSDMTSLVCRKPSSGQPEHGPTPESEPDLHAGGRRRVLVAEDVKMMSSLIEAILTGCGYDVVCVATTPEACEALDAGHFDLVLTDLLMPGGGGRGLMAFIGSLPTPVPVLVVTGVTDDHVEREAMAMGAVGYIRKPFKRADLTQAVDEILAQKDD